MFRDPRNIVLSEHRMRIEVYNQTDTAKIIPFIQQRFEGNARTSVHVHLPDDAWLEYVGMAAADDPTKQAVG